MPEITLPNNWRPRWYQRRLWQYLQGGGKRAIAVWHRRAGKDDVCLHWTARSAFQRVGNYWHMLPQQNQAKKAIWRAVNPHTGQLRIDEAFPHALREKTLEDEMYIRFRSGSSWQVLGSDSYNSHVGSAPVGIVFSEWALSNPSAWAYLRPILAENGGWAFFISTPRGRNHLATMYEAALDDADWFSEKLSAKDTDVFTAEQLDAEERAYVTEFQTSLGEDAARALFRQEYLCDFDAPIIGSYYGAEMRRAEEDKRIDRVPYDPAVPVYTAWDIGIGDSTSIWFVQLVGHNIHVVDFYEASGEGLAHYAGVIQKRGYVYAEHLGPHDLQAKEWGSGRSREEQARELGLKFRVVPNVAIDDGINAVRTILPRCVFDRAKCQYGIEALKQYRKDFDEDHKVFRDKPLHDWTSHAADAFRYLALGIRDRYAPPPTKWERTFAEEVAESLWMRRGQGEQRRI